MTLRSVGRRSVLTVAHVLFSYVALLLAYLVRFDFTLPASETVALYQALSWVLFPKLFFYWLFGCDRGSLRYVGLPDLGRLAAAAVAGSMAFTAVTLALVGRAFPRSVYCIDFLIWLALAAGLRVLLRLGFERRRRRAREHACRRVLIYGAGAAGHTLLREMLTNPSLNYRPVGFLDDAPSNQGLSAMGLSVLGRGRQAAAIVERHRARGRPIDEIVIAMPSATGREMGEAIANCRAAGVPFRTVPGFGELLTHRVPLSHIRHVRVEDLLGRQQVHLEEEQIRPMVQGRSILVTGGGGSIGSELCRQIASFQPERLVIFERAETDLYRIHMELSVKWPNLRVVPQIGDIREPERVEEALRLHGTESVFHAAAYKHVPMMERHPLEAVRNNILGTRNLVVAAEEARVANFLMISSDKAVNPTSVMGVTKRVAELIVSAMPPPTATGRTKFVSVRFGNVLASNGSVVPLFQDQIAAGGPVTVTHPDMRRYFMTIREAVELVLQASTMGDGSEIFVLDMGEPLRIADLARNMIRLSGKRPDIDIEIRYVGLRPGEKLFEEIVLEGEDMLPTRHPKIRVFRAPRPDRASIESWLEELEARTARRDEPAVMEHLCALVPEYQAGSQRRSPGRARPLTATAAAS